MTWMDSYYKIIRHHIEQAPDVRALQEIVSTQGQMLRDDYCLGSLLWATSAFFALASYAGKQENLHPEIQGNTYISACCAVGLSLMGAIEQETQRLESLKSQNTEEEDDQ